MIKTKKTERLTIRKKRDLEKKGIIVYIDNRIEFSFEGLRFLLNAQSENLITDFKQESIISLHNQTPKNNRRLYIVRQLFPTYTTEESVLFIYLEGTPIRCLQSIKFPCFCEKKLMINDFQRGEILYDFYLEFTNNTVSELYERNILIIGEQAKYP